MLCGAFAGGLVAGLSLLWPEPSSAAPTGDGFSWMWRGALASFYGGIVKEVQSRLLLVSLFVWLLMLAGTVFGALYWKLGLEHAMVAHFCADLLLHVAMPALSG